MRVNPAVLRAVAATVDSAGAALAAGAHGIEAPTENAVVAVRGWNAAGGVEVTAVSWRDDLAGPDGLAARVGTLGDALVEAARGYVLEDEVSAALFDGLGR